MATCNTILHTCFTYKITHTEKEENKDTTNKSTMVQAFYRLIMILCKVQCTEIGHNYYLVNNSFIDTKTSMIIYIY